MPTEMRVEAPIERILVVDDDVATRLTLVKLLSKEGYEVLQASNGAQALDAIAEQMPSLILLDVIMPGISGFEVCEAIRARDTRVPIIMLTGIEDVSSIDSAFAKGATDFITKPINWPLLIRRVRYSLRTHALRVDLERIQIIQSEAQEIARLGYFEWCPTYNRIHWSSGLLNLFELPKSIDGTGLSTYLSMLPPQDRTDISIQLDQVASGQLKKAVFEHAFSTDAGNFHVRAMARSTRDKQVLVVLQDVTDSYQAKATVEFQRSHDTLTHLVNRTQFFRLLDDSLAQQQRCAVITIDIDRFHMINDSFGQDEGDNLLQLFSLRLHALTHGFYSLARLGGDEFGILVEELEGEDELHEWLSAMQKRLSEPYELAGQPVFIETSVGVSVSPEHGNNAHALLSASLQARLVAKRRGGSCYQVFDQSCQQDYARQLYLETELRHAISRDEFELFYQPQLELATNRIIGAEALIRWRHPVMGLVSPGEFIPLVEEMELIHNLGSWVAEEAVRQQARWQAEGLQLRLGFNMSARQFNDTYFANRLERMLAAAGVAAESMDIEITESSAMDNPGNAMGMVKSLKALGCSIAIDDFGTGYSSLEYMQKFAVDYIKIDRVFICNLLNSPADQGIVKAIMGIAASMDMKVIAEGVEQKEEMDFLRDLGCHEMQGFYLSKPLPAEEFARFTHQHNGQQSPLPA